MQIWCFDADLFELFVKVVLSELKQSLNQLY